MFESVGRTKKQDRRHQAGSFLLSLAVNGGFIGGLILAGATVAEEVVDDLPVEVHFFDAAPPPPPPPPPAGGGQKKTEKKKPDEPKETPKDVEPEPTDLPEEVPEEVVETEEAGVEGGVEGGVVGGVVGGVIGGVLGGQLGGTGARAVHWSEVKAKRRVKPTYPKAAQQLGLEASCQLRFFIDEKGKPYEVKIEKCPKVFHDSALKAAWAWRFYPMREEGKALKAQFVLNITFKLN